MNAEQLERLYATMKASGEMTAAALRRWRSTNRLTPDPELADAPDPARRATGETLESLKKVVAPVPFPTSVSRPKRLRPAAKPNTAASSQSRVADRYDLRELDKWRTRE